jgi:hypothetical protein
LSIVEFWLAVTVLVALNNPSVKVAVKRYFDMFLRFIVLFVFIIAVGLIFWNYNFPIMMQFLQVFFLKSGSINYGKYDIKHEIYIPDSFMQRVEVYDKAQYEPNSRVLVGNNCVSCT